MLALEEQNIPERETLSAMTSIQFPQQLGKALRSARKQLDLGAPRFLRTQPTPPARAPALPVKTHSLSPFGAAPSEREPLKAFLFEEGGAKRRKEWGLGVGWEHP
jgi:hypothetical protein